MKVIIVEDELPAQEKLNRYLLKYDPTIEIAVHLSSIAEAVKWLQNPLNTFDIAFMDIQLTDGLSFEIFNQHTINKPIIFVTAFDEYAIDAFKVNSIDYILKPITFTDVSKALNKLKNIKTNLSSATVEKVANTLKEGKSKDRFVVRLGNHIHSIKTAEIALFYAEGRTVFLMTNKGKKFIIDYKLEELSHLLNTKHFFRTNRTYLININSIADVTVYSNSRLKINPNVSIEGEIIVSRERVASFKSWFEGN